LMLVAGTNFFIDPAHYINKVAEQEIAQQLLNGNNILNFSDCNDRSIQRYLILKDSLKYKTVVLGSSHTMLFNKDNVKSTSFFNRSVGGAVIEDLVGIYLLMKQKNVLPDTIILCLDAAALNNNHGQTRWQEFLYELSLNCKSSNLALPENINPYYPLWFTKNQMLLSPDYFQQSLKMVSSKKSALKIEFKLDSNTINMIKYKDGNIRYPLSLINQNKLEKDKLITEYINGKLSLYDNFNKLSSNYMLWFEWLINDMQKNNIQVIGVLPSFHPAVYNYFKSNYRGKLILESEIYFKNLCQRKNVELYGSYNPAFNNLTDSDFYNADHFNENAIPSIFTNK
jgi:hypothetical protein